MSEDFSDRLEQASESAQAVNVREHLAHWNTFMAQPWSPDTLTVAGISGLKGKPVVWLNEAVDLMAFGLNPPAEDCIECGARRRQASRALCDGARLGIFSLFGSPDVGGSESKAIPRDYFDIHRQIGGRENSLEIDYQLASENNFHDAHLGHHQAWFNVRIAETKQFMEWLGNSGPKKTGGRPAEFNWAGSRLHCLSLVAKYGKPGRGNNKLPRQADLIDAVVEYFAKQDIHPARPTIKKRVSQWLREA